MVANGLIRTSKRNKRTIDKTNKIYMSVEFTSTTNVTDRYIVLVDNTLFSIKNSQPKIFPTIKTTIRELKVEVSNLSSYSRIL